MVGLPRNTTGADLVSASGKKSMLKQGAAWKMGQPRDLNVTHMDGSTMKLQMQVRVDTGRVWHVSHYLVSFFTFMVLYIYIYISIILLFTRFDCGGATPQQAASRAPQLNNTAAQHPICQWRDPQ